MPSYRVRCDRGSTIAIEAPNEGAPITLLNGRRYILKNAQVREIEEEERCWCQYSPDDRFPTVFVIQPRQEPVRVEIEFCPQCGRFLKG